MTDRMIDRHRLCKLPRLWKGRYRHRLFVCDCGRAWMARWRGAGGGGFWSFEEWGGQRNDCG